MRLQAWKAMGGFLLAALLAVPAWGMDVGRPGTINYVEGKAWIGSRALDAKSVGTAELGAGQALRTEKGKAEILLTPGVFVRLDDASTLTMVSPTLTNTEVRLDKGRALIEVTEIHRENDLLVSQNRVTTRLLKTGLYSFDADQNQVRVFDGKALVETADRGVEIKGGRELDLNSAGLVKPQKFNKKRYHDDLYNWSSLRSDYLAEANADTARTYVVGGPGWYGGGWYWSPWFDCYTFIPGDGILYSPFGWGFYSPLWVYQAPVIIEGSYPRRFDRFDRDRDDRFRDARPAFAAHPSAGYRPAYRPAPVFRAPHQPGEIGHSFGRGFHEGGHFSHGARRR